METRSALGALVAASLVVGGAVVATRWGVRRFDETRRRVQDVREEPSVEATAGVLRAQYERVLDRVGMRRGSPTSTLAPSLSATARRAET